jgi:23S rRNA pseudouridine1911/1915/1917 synthase
LARQFEQRRVVKRYLAVVVGALPDEGEISAPLRRDPADRRRVIVAEAGKPAHTRYRVLAASDGFALALVEPLTGRTHQIRAHLAHRGAPLAGDALYGGASEAALAAGIGRALLHAWELRFRHPATSATAAICAPIPSDMRAALSTLRLAEEVELAEDALAGMIAR